MRTGFDLSAWMIPSGAARNRLDEPGTSRRSIRTPNPFRLISEMSDKRNSTDGTIGERHRTAGAKTMPSLRRVRRTIGPDNPYRHVRLDEYVAPPTNEASLTPES